jgi:ubiquinone/menaquinone biosynthesis C-methylase UbiE
MTASARLFDEKLSAFKEQQNAPWGRLRYGIAFTNLQRHLDDGPLRVLDAGGGNGLDAIPFAARGHAVALLDYSTEMLAEARRNAEANGVAERMTFHQADLAAIPSLFPEAQFDVVLCHNVLQYVGDVGTALKAMCHALRPGGLISILSVNRYSEAYRQALQQLNLDAAYRSLDATSIMTTIFGVRVQAYAAEDLRQPLQEAGYSVVGEYGVRCVCDYIPNNDIKSDPAFFTQLERLEYAMSDKYPYYLLARYFQVIARKTVP